MPDVVDAFSFLSNVFLHSWCSRDVFRVLVLTKNLVSNVFGRLCNSSGGFFDQWNFFVLFEIEICVSFRLKTKKIVKA